MADDQLDDGALCTLTQVMTSLGLSTVSALKRRQLIDAINEASAQAVSYCGRQGVGGFHFVASYTEAVPGYNTPTITVQRYPLTRVISVVGNDGAVDVSGLILDGPAGIIRRRSGVWGSTAAQTYGMTGDAKRGSEQPTSWSPQTAAGSRTPRWPLGWPRGPRSPPTCGAPSFGWL